MPIRKRPAYTVIDSAGEKHFFKTKKEICDEYGMKLGYVTKAILYYPLRSKESPVWITYFCCKHCDRYMIEDCDCYKKVK